MVRFKFCGPVLNHAGHLGTIVKGLQFFIGFIVIGIVITRVALSQDEGSDILILQITMGSVIKFYGISMKEKYLIVDRGGVGGGSE